MFWLWSLSLIRDTSEKCRPESNVRASQQYAQGLTPPATVGLAEAGYEELTQGWLTAFESQPSEI